MGVAVGPDRAGRFAAGLRLARPATTDELYWIGRVTLAATPAEIATYDRVFDDVFRGVADVADSPRRLQPAEPRIGRPWRHPSRHRRAGIDRHWRRTATVTGGGRRRLPGRRRGRRAERCPDRCTCKRGGAAASTRLRGLHVRGARRATADRGSPGVDRAHAAEQAPETTPIGRHDRPPRDAATGPPHGRPPGGARSQACHRTTSPGRADRRRVGLDGVVLARLSVPPPRGGQGAGAPRRSCSPRGSPTSPVRCAPTTPNGRCATRSTMSTTGRAAPASAKRSASFNDRFGRRGLARGAIVVIVSDGWESDDPALLGEQMARL